MRRFGPVGIYGHRFRAPVYNHGPLAGWMLGAINWLLDRGIASFEFLIRVPACLADFVTALLLFELVRVVRPVKEAAIAAVLVGCSPLLFVISGFHGNTDPVFVMFALLSTYLLVVRGWALAAGAAFGIAVSIKLVPAVLAPVLLVVLVRLGWRRLAAFVGGGTIVFWLLWVPVIVTRWDAFRGAGPRLHRESVSAMGAAAAPDLGALAGRGRLAGGTGPLRDPARERARPYGVPGALLVGWRGLPS